MNFVNGCSILQRAVWRMTYRDPLNALLHYQFFTNSREFLMALVSIRERCERALLRSFLNRWRNNVIGRRELWNKRRAALRFLIALMDARARAIMSSKFANWKRVLQVNVDEVLAKFRTLIEMLTRYSNNVIRPTKKDFLNRVSRFTNPNYQTKVLKKTF
jgi:hypothetical protein